MQLEFYRTTDLSLSAFLQTRGHKIIEIKSERGRGFFGFEDTRDLRQDILKWSNGDHVEINARAFGNALRDLKGMVGHG